MAKHFVDPNDERKLTGIHDADQIKQMFATGKEDQSNTEEEGKKQPDLGTT